MNFESRSIYLGFILVMVWTFSLLADEEETHEETFPTHFVPWFTGPLIAPSGYTVKPGDVSIQPYLYFYVFNAIYDRHWKAHSQPNFYTTRVQIQTRIGVAKSIDFRVYPQAFYNETEGRHYINIGDLSIGPGFQLVRAGVDDPFPAIKLNLRVSVPIGKYQKLQPHLKGTDAIGSGSWEPTAILIFSKLWHTAPTHFLSTRLVFNYQFGTPIHVKRFNTYGGSANTYGTVHQGDIFSVNGAFQYNLTHRWALAGDLLYTHNNKNRFSGKTTAINSSPSREQFSLAPAIEYNWSRDIGIIGGIWFTFAGRNSGRFVTSVIAVNIYI